MRLRLQGWGIHVSFQRVATVRTTRVRTGAVANDHCRHQLDLGNEVISTTNISHPRR